MLWDPLDDVMSAADAAERLGMAPGTVKNLCAAGRLSAVKINRTWIITLSNPDVFNHIMSTADAAERWNYSTGYVKNLCGLGLVDGAKRIGHCWIIRKDAPKPIWTPDALKGAGANER